MRRPGGPLFPSRRPRAKTHGNNRGPEKLTSGPLAHLDQSRIQPVSTDCVGRLRVKKLDKTDGDPDERSDRNTLSSDLGSPPEQAHR